MVSELTNLNLLRQPHEKPGVSAGDLAAEDELAEMVPHDEDSILCRQCLQVITRPQERVEMEGSHQHTFANPGGIVYQIGCFQSAKGGAQTGPATDEFTWFKGFSWRIVVCRTCLLHLGWVFTSHTRGLFYGLILDRLIFPD